MSPFGATFPPGFWGAILINLHSRLRDASTNPAKMPGYGCNIRLTGLYMQK